MGGIFAATFAALRRADGFIRPTKTVLLLGFVIGSKYALLPAFCKTACYV